MGKWWCFGEHAGATLYIKTIRVTKLEKHTLTLKTQKNTHTKVTRVSIRLEIIKDLGHKDNHDNG